MTVLPLRARNGTVRAWAIVDAADWPIVSQHRWNYDGRYAGASIGGRRVRLHRFLMGEPPQPGLEVDHRDRDPLNNRRQNLRWSTHQANRANTGAQRTARTSAHRGVHWHAGKWVATARRNYRKHHLGRFVNEKDAAEAVRRFWAQFDG